MSEEDKKNNLLMRVHEMVVRTDEKLKGIVDSMKDNSDRISKKFDEMQTKVDVLEKRVEELEKQGVKVSSFWKVLCIGIPVFVSIISILINLYHITL